MLRPVTYSRSRSTAYLAWISSSRAASASTCSGHQLSSGHCGETMMNGNALPCSISFGGPCFLTRARSSPRSPAPCKNSIKGHFWSFFSP